MHRLAVGLDRHGAVAIGLKIGTRRAQPVQDGGAGWPKIARPDTDHGDLRPQRVHQHSACG